MGKDRIWKKKEELIDICKVLVLITFLILASFMSHGQSPKKNNKRGLRYFNKGNYVKALEQFRLSLDSEWNKNETVNYVSLCLFELHRPDMVKALIEKHKVHDATNLFNLVHAHYYLEEFANADKVLKLLGTTGYAGTKMLSDLINQGQKTYQSGEGFVIQNFGPNINSSNREYSSVMYDDFNALMFTSRRNETGRLG